MKHISLIFVFLIGTYAFSQNPPCNLTGGSVYIDNNATPRMMNASVNGMSLYTYCWTDSLGIVVGTANQIPFYTRWCVTIVDNMTGCDTTIYQDCIADTNALCPCMMIYMPVCGCDGVQYANSCIADCADVPWIPATSNGMPGGFLPCNAFVYPAPVGCGVSPPVACGVEIIGDSILCNWNNPQILTASPNASTTLPVTHQWYGNGMSSNSNILTIISPGTYCVVQIDANGCIDTACIAVAVQDIPIYTNPSPPEICLGDSIIMEIDTVGLNNIIWVPTGAINTINRVVDEPTSSTTYVVEALDNGSCERRGEVFVEVDSCNNGPCAIPFLYVEHDTINNILEASQLSSNFTYLWTNGDTTHYTSYYANWCLYVVDMNGCDTTICDTVVTSLFEDIESNIRIYPNPASADMIFDIPQGERFALQIFDVRGKQIMFDSDIINRFVIKEGDLLNGTYIVKFLHRDGMVIRKIIIE